MPHREPTPLVIAVRAYPDLKSADRNSRHPPPHPPGMMVFATESRIDATQRLTFGSYQFIDDESCLAEKLFYGEDLPAKDRRTLQRYVATLAADRFRQSKPKLELITRHKFADKLFLNAYRG